MWIHGRLEIYDTTSQPFNVGKTSTLPSRQTFSNFLGDYMFSRKKCQVFQLLFQVLDARNF